jgi:aldehyde dehydrogenase (NAD+)
MQSFSTSTEILEAIGKQKAFFAAGSTRSVAARKQVLRQLLHMLQVEEQKIFDALHADLNKTNYEAYLTEIGPSLAEVKYLLKGLGKWSKPKRVGGFLAGFPSKSFIQAEPYGTALIISTWNYPLYLAITPVAAAIAAGNNVILKPSEYAPHTERLLVEIIEKHIPKEWIWVVNGGVEESKFLLQQKFEYIFFTGSTQVGYHVMKAAAEHLTPVTLELGGKSPCIVDSSASIKVAAMRIAWGKYINAGQTCVAPDYLYVHESVYDRFVEELKKAFSSFKVENPEGVAKIIDARHFDRLEKLLGDKKPSYGGLRDKEKLHFAPTILGNVGWDDAVMQEEIFGPLLPIIKWSNEDDMIAEIKKQAAPLSLYVFSNNKAFQDKVIDEIPFGGGCINDVIAHLGNANLPFGGVGQSGMGHYHGKYGFDTFSHKKSILKKPVWPDFAMRYPPYKKGVGLLRRIF